MGLLMSGFACMHNMNVGFYCVKYIITTCLANYISKTIRTTFIKHDIVLSFGCRCSDLVRQEEKRLYAMYSPTLILAPAVYG